MKVDERARNVKLLVSDVDGVLTDGGIYIFPDGSEGKKFTVEDGAGVALARFGGLKLAFISGRRSKVTENRLNELKVTHFRLGAMNKVQVLEEYCREFGVPEEEVAYIGDGLVDIPVMERCGFRVSPPNGHELVKEIAHVITTRPGGAGAFRETVELILRAQGKFSEALEKMRHQVYLKTPGNKYF